MHGVIEQKSADGIVVDS